jgi:cation transport ATPase
VTNLQIKGMSCGNCARHVTEAIQGVPGVRNAAVSLENKSATVRWNDGAPENVTAVIEAVKKAGYEAAEAESEDECSTHRRKNWQFNLWLGIVVTAFLMIGEWGLRLGMTPWFQWLSFVLAGLVQVFAGAQYYRGAWNQLKAGSSNMDTLVALGSTTAFGYSVWALMSGAGGHLYFMEAAAIITLISGGHWIEARVGDKASSALKSLLNLAPQKARKIREPGAEVEVPVSELEMGDRVALRPGDRVPVDGVVMEGDSAVDESMLTGESLPADKKAGGELFAGTVNLNGSLVMRVTATGESTALAHIIAAVERAQTSRANIQRLGDRISSIFVPAVVAVAILAGLCWGLAPESAGGVHAWLAHFLWPAATPAGVAAGFIIAAAVLIVACPCAMGLATPAAIMAAANAAARRGILIRDGVALEKAGLVTAVVFDKTGTLTVDKPEVAAEWCPSQEPSSHCGVWSLECGLAEREQQADTNSSVEGCEQASGSGIQRASSSGKSHPESQNPMWPPHPVPLPRGGEGAVSASEGAVQGGNAQILSGISHPESQNSMEPSPQEPSPHPDPLPSHPMGAEREQQADANSSVEGCEQASGPGVQWANSSGKSHSESQNPMWPPHPVPLPRGGEGAVSVAKRIAGALARHSTHPISQAIARISTEDVSVADWKEIRGSGVEGTIETGRARLGSLRWLKDCGADVSSGEKFIAEWSSQGATVIGLAVETKLLGLFAVRNAVKPNAAKVVEQLKSQGLKVYMVTGDNSPTAASIARLVGIEDGNVFAEVRPEQKAEFVKKLQLEGAQVAFVGDGINDAPALTQADLGIAVSRASGVAREAADIILLKSGIEAVPEALGLARATLRTIKQNLFWAFFYNALGVPLAALGFMSPIWCAAAMGASDLIVIGNALRLLRRGRWKTEDGR